MGIVLENAILIDLDPKQVEIGSLRIDGGRIVERASSVSRQPGDEVVDCRGAVVLPGLVNGHTHLYSALAAGMPPPPQCPSNFEEVLKYVWWRLDRALDAESNEMSSRIGAIGAVRCGTTTLIDHHASPNCIRGSLDHIEKGLAEIGLRGVLCYETTDRNGPQGRDAGLEENRRYLEKCTNSQNNKFAGMAGAHASFTLEGETLDKLASLAEGFGVGVHIHVAEDPCDEEQCQAQNQTLLIDWLTGHGILRSDSILAHGTHLNEDAAKRIAGAGAMVAHCPRSNMNNAVGYAPIKSFGNHVMLGTDGIGSDMLTEAQTGWFIACHEHAGLTPSDVLNMMVASARRASAALDITLGQLTVNAAADVVITDYVPFTPIHSENLAGHVLFALGAQYIHSVIGNGKFLMRNRTITTCDESAVRRAASKISTRLWDRLAKIHS